MKEKDIKQGEPKRPESEASGEPLRHGEPFIFKEDKKVIEELARQNKYIRGLFSK